MTRLRRLHQALVDALIQSRPHALDEPVTVAEIYQDLVPYRTVRSDLGFAMNADYEHALMQLLAGEEELARIEPIEIREQLRLELEMANPDVGLFREFAACDVFVTIPDGRYEPAQPVLETVAPPPPPPQNPLESLEKRTELPFELPSSAPPPLTAENVREPATLDTPAGNAGGAAEISEQSVHMPPPGIAAVPVRCTGCEEALPAEREVRFCPYCGHDQTQHCCSSCGEVLERSWRFCIRCGTAAQSIAR